MSAFHPEGGSVPGRLFAEFFAHRTEPPYGRGQGGASGGIGRVKLPGKSGRPRKALEPESDNPFQEQ